MPVLQRALVPWSAFGYVGPVQDQFRNATRVYLYGMYCIGPWECLLEWYHWKFKTDSSVEPPHWCWGGLIPRARVDISRRGYIRDGFQEKKSQWKEDETFLTKDGKEASTWGWKQRSKLPSDKHGHSVRERSLEQGLSARVILSPHFQAGHVWIHLYLLGYCCYWDPAGRSRDAPLSIIQKQKDPWLGTVLRSSHWRIAWQWDNRCSVRRPMLLYPSAAPSTLWLPCSSDSAAALDQQEKLGEVRPDPD